MLRQPRSMAVVCDVLGASGATLAKTSLTGMPYLALGLLFNIVNDLEKVNISRPITAQG